MSKRFKLTVLVVFIVVALMMSSIPLTGAQDTKILRSAFLPGDLKLDPALATWINEILVINEMYVGLTSLNEDTALTEMGLATSWEASDDGMTYTFNLMPDVPWVIYDADAGEVVKVTDENGDVRMVTAQDVVYGTARTLNPETGSQYAGTLAPWLVGGVETVAGEDVELGIVALDDYTLQMTSPKAVGFLPMMYGLWMSRPAPQWAVEEFGDAWTEAGNYPSYGPYALKEWEHDVRISFIKNPYWPGNDAVPQAKIDEYDFVYLEEPAMLAAFEADELDWIPVVPLPDLPRLRAQYPDELAITPDICTYYYGFNVEIEPTNNVHMRRALSMAIDRETVVQITAGGQQPAGFFTRPDIAAGPSQEDYPDLAIWSDNEGAKAELALYFEETGYTLDTMPPIMLMHNTSTAHATVAQAIQQMWQETLGIEVQISSQDAQTYNETLRRDAPPVWRLGWCYDYPDANSFIYDHFRTKGPDSNNHTNWGNEEFYALIDEAAALTDVEARRELYAQAEYILVNQDAAVAPIYFYTTQQMTKTWVERSFAVHRQEKLEKWDILQ